MRGLRNLRTSTTEQTHPVVLVITDHANLQYYREPQDIWDPASNGLTEKLAEYNIQLVYKPGSRPTSGRAVTTTGPDPS